MEAEAILAIVGKIAAGVGAAIFAALGWSIRQLLADLRRELSEIRALAIASDKRLVAGDVTISDIKRRIDKLEQHDEDRCRTCRWEAAQIVPTLTPVPPRGG